MQLFCKKRKLSAQSFMLKLVNNHCPELKARIEGPRAESRVPLSVPVLVIPLVGGRAAVERMFPAMTKEASTSGLSLVLDTPKALEEVILGIRFEGEMAYLSGTAKYLNPLGAGFYQLGVELTEMVHPRDYPGLEEAKF